MLSIFLCVCVFPFLYLCEESITVFYLLLVFFFFKLLTCKSSFHILATSFLSDICIANIFLLVSVFVAAEVSLYWSVFVVFHFPFKNVSYKRKSPFLEDTKRISKSYCGISYPKILIKSSATGKFRVVG